jgi:hypothetical protein
LEMEAEATEKLPFHQWISRLKWAAASATKGYGFQTEMGSVYGTFTETGRNVV